MRNRNKAINAFLENVY